MSLPTIYICSLILVVSWLPLEPLRYCLSHTGCKLIILDTERANLIEPATSDILRDTAAAGLLVFDSHEGKGLWEGINCFHAAVQDYNGDVGDILAGDSNLLPEDNAAIMFTSGECILYFLR